MLTPPATGVSFRHDLRLPNQPILPFDSSAVAPEQPLLISQQVQELQRLFGENESLIDRNIEGLEALTHKWDRTKSRTLDDTQKTLTSIEHELEDMLAQLKAKPTRASTRRSSRVPPRLLKRVSNYLDHSYRQPSPVDLERSKTLDLTYAALTAAEDSFDVLQSTPNDPMGPLYRSFDLSLPRMSPAVRKRLDGILGSMDEVTKVVPPSPTNNEVMTELVGSVSNVIDAFSL